MMSALKRAVPALVVLLALAGLGCRKPKKVVEPAGISAAQLLTEGSTLLKKGKWLEGRQRPQEEVRVVDPVGVEAEGIARRKGERELLQSLPPARRCVRVVSEFDERHTPTYRKKAAKSAKFTARQ